MSKFRCTIFDKKNQKNKDVGYMEIKNSNVRGVGELYLYGDIVSDQWGRWSDDDTCPQDVADFLRELNSFDDLDIFINSGGGSVFAGIAIYNQLKRHNGVKTVHIDGIAASIASVIACAGDKIIIPKASQFMIHKPSCCFFLESLNADELRKQADTLDVCQDSIRSIYMDSVKDGVTEEKINELINAETWFTGENVTEYFNFEIEECSEKVASISQFYNKYRNTPKNLLTVKENKNNDNNILKNKLQIELELLCM